MNDAIVALTVTIATRAFPPRVAVGLASSLNVVGAFISVAVAAAIASGIVEQAEVTVPIIFAGLVGAILWNVTTWFVGIPSSSSHALIGGVVGAVIAGVGSGAVIWDGIVSKVLIPAVQSQPDRIELDGRARPRDERRAEDDGVIAGVPFR